MESHIALGVGEQYRAYLRILFKRIRADHPAAPVKVALSMAVWKMNQTAGPRRLTPALLAFGIHPRMLFSPIDLPSQRERCKALLAARTDMWRQVARDGLDSALRTQNSRAADNDTSPGMQLLAFRENPADKRKGPYRVVGCSSKQVCLGYQYG